MEMSTGSLLSLTSSLEVGCAPVIIQDGEQRKRLGGGGGGGEEEGEERRGGGEGEEEIMLISHKLHMNTEVV